MKTSSEIYLNGKRLRLDPRHVIGKGGEADVYDIGSGRALKLYKAPEHPDFQLQPEAREAARRRIAEQQRKLRQFPRHLPAKVVAPELLATDDPAGQHIVGYTMPLLQGAEVLLRFSDRIFRESGGITCGQTTVIFRELHEAMLQVHQAGVVIGDFNDLNVLIRAGHKGRDEVFLIDADSFQFGPFPCRVFTARFVDPLLCDAAAADLVLAKPHTVHSDWYAFGVMLMQCLLYVEPYGGLYRPKDSTRRIAHHRRPLHRITIFHPEVRYPKPATHWGVLPDDLLHFFHVVFEKDHREVFPRRLLDDLRWTTCTVCGAEHARSHCPFCVQAAPAAIKETTVIRGSVTATRIFQTRGIILNAVCQHNKLRYLFHEGGLFKREDGSVVAQGELDPKTIFRICGDATLLGRDGQMVVLRLGATPERISVDSHGARPIIAANQDHIYWVQAGQLWRGEPLGPQYIGDVLQGQTRFWCGPAFGFGFYQAGEFNVAFVFDAEKGGINDSIPLPPIPGQIFDANCVFAPDRCWFFIAVQETGRLINRCFVIRRDGSLEASTQVEHGDGSWLGAGLRGKCASGAFLLAPTEEGIARIEIAGDSLTITKQFPGTEPFVHASSHLLPGPDGLYVVGAYDIHLLKIR